MAKVQDEKHANITRDGGVTYITVPTLVVGANGQEIKGMAELAFNFDIGSQGVDSATAGLQNTADLETVAERRQTRSQERSGNGFVETLIGRVHLDPSYLGSGRLNSMHTAEQHAAQTYSERSLPPSHFDAVSEQGRARIEDLLVKTLNPTLSSESVQKLQAKDNTLLLESQNKRNYPLDIGTSENLSIFNGSATLLPEKNGHPILGIGLSSIGQGKYVDEKRNELLITSVDTIRHEFFHLVDPQFNKAGVGAKTSVEDRAVHHVNTFLAAEGRAPRASYVVPLPGMAQANDIPIDTYHQSVLAKEMPGGPAPRPGLIRSFPEYESQVTPTLQNRPEPHAQANSINQHLSTLSLDDSAKTLIKEHIAENMLTMQERNVNQDSQLS